MEAINQPMMTSVPFKGFWIRLVAALLDGIFVVLFVLLLLLSGSLGLIFGA